MKLDLTAFEKALTALDRGLPASARHSRELLEHLQARGEQDA